VDAFTAHNIRFPNGECTIPGAPIWPEGDQVEAVLRTLNIAFAGQVSGKTLVDLGCLEGGWTAEFARAGFDALGIEARKVNIEKCKYVAEHLNLPNLRFCLDDALNIEQRGRFDAVFCSGLLYHLEDPAAYLRTLGEVTRRVLIIQTHYATAEESVPRQTYSLSDLVTHEGNLGRWYEEYPADADSEWVEQQTWTSYGNSRSFWLEKRHLLQVLRDVGFSPVYEQFDFLANAVTDDYIERHDRSLFVAYKADYDFNSAEL
jgi:SAM-dependent methyltransferase